MIIAIVFSFSIADTVLAGSSEDGNVSHQIAPCSVPLSDDWIVTSDCILTTNTIAPQNVWIQNNSVVTIPNQITLGVNFANFNLTVFSGSGLLIQFGWALTQQELVQGEFEDCSDGWTVTGYYIPLESDFIGNFITIIIDGETRQFKQDFVDSIKVEGWGKTLLGDYLGWYGNSFHLNNNAVDVDGNPLVVGVIAVDTAIVTPDSNLIIPTLPNPWNEVIFLSSDEGTGVTQQHIDVFTGVGIAAEQETFRITGSGNTVCQ